MSAHDVSSIEQPTSNVTRPPLFTWIGQLLCRLGPAGPMAVITFLLPLVGVAALGGVMYRVGPILRRAWWGPPATIGAYVLLGGVALLPTMAMSVFAGWVFGLVIGLPTAVAGLAGVAVVNYEVARRASGRRVVELVDTSPRWRAVHRALLQSGVMRTFWIVALLRLPTAPPFGVTNVVLGSVHVRRLPFILGTCVGVVPRTAAYVFLADRAGTLDFQAGSNGWFFAIWLGVTVLVLAFVTLLARRALTRLTGSDAASAVDSADETSMK